MKRFNTTGKCIDSKHYMVRIDRQVEEAVRLVQDGMYFCINRGRRPIINGVGNYYCEAATRDLTRTDVIIDYLGQQYIVELKIWRGDSYNQRGERQLTNYLLYYGLNTGYMVSFCFNKNKQSGVHDIIIGDKTICEAVV